MRYEELEQLMGHALPIKILRARSAPLLISFLYAEFKKRNRIAISSYELTSRLSDYLEQIKDKILRFSRQCSKMRSVKKTIL